MYQQPKVSGANPLKKLPAPIKRLLSKLYWLSHDAADYFAELTGVIPSHTLRRWIYHYLFKVKIGQKTSLHRGCRFYHPSGVCVGNHSVINRNVLLDGRMGITIGNNVSISEGTFILTLQHDLNDATNFDNTGAPVVIEDYVFIGSKAMLMPGVTIGRGAAVGAGAIVTKNVEAFTIVAGVPAKPIGMRRQDLTYQLDYKKFLG
jgi:acetyltransferase-like isoleucine patch superfamily enzyme